ncbi:MAG: DUF2600 family protein [Firmicutes bacterium]|nr:DUF2600 family protein [Bacillota bacterium]
MREWLLVAELVVRGFAAADRRLTRYLQLAEDSGAECEDAAQARLSIQTKRFHCQGAAAFACLTPLREPLWDAITALQTMSDYLDNLCDRAGPSCASPGGLAAGDAAARTRFRRLHDAMRAAVEPPLLPPGGIATAVEDLLLRTLVEDCHRNLAVLPSYRVVQAQTRRMVDLYCDLQSYKHLPPGRREATLKAWHARWSRRPGFVGEAARQLTWYEFAAASGSTLGMFALFRLAALPGVGAHQADAVVRAYFPYICGLHILLDYLIDMEEDLASDDLNFVSPYRTWERARSVLTRFTRRALEAAATLPDAWFHRTVVKGLLALYLSDPKVRGESLERVARALIRAAGPPTATLWRLCRHLRNRGVVPASWQPAGVSPATGTGCSRTALPDGLAGEASGGEPRWRSGT